MEYTNITLKIFEYAFLAKMSLEYHYRTHIFINHIIVINYLK